MVSICSLMLLNKNHVFNQYSVIGFWRGSFNSLAPEGCSNDLKHVISTHMLWINFMGTFYETVHKWMSQNTFDEKSTSIQVISLCRQTTSHYMSQCWLRSVSPYGATRSQWVKWIALRCNYLENFEGIVNQILCNNKGFLNSSVKGFQSIN